MSLRFWREKKARRIVDFVLDGPWRCSFVLTCILESIVHQSMVHYLCTKLRYLTNWTLDMAIFFDIATLELQIQQFFTTCFSWWRANLLIFYRTLLSHYCSPHHFTYFLGPVILAAVSDNEVITLFRSSVWIDNSICLSEYMVREHGPTHQC